MNQPPAAGWPKGVWEKGHDKLGKKIEESEFECYLAIIWQSPCGVLQLRDSDLRSAKVGCNLVMIDLE